MTHGRKRFSLPKYCTVIFIVYFCQFFKVYIYLTIPWTGEKLLKWMLWMARLSEGPSLLRITSHSSGRHTLLSSKISALIVYCCDIQDYCCTNTTRSWRWFGSSAVTQHDQGAGSGAVQLHNTIRALVREQCSNTTRSGRWFGSSTVTQHDQSAGSGAVQ